MTRFRELVLVSTQVAATGSRKAKVARLAELMRALDPVDVPVAVSYLAGNLVGGRIGVGWSALRRARTTPPATSPVLRVADVHQALSAVGTIAGKGSRAARQAALEALFARATTQEQHFIACLILGELRQGALEGVIMAALAEASGASIASVRRAAMLSGSLPQVATAALTHGEPGLDRFSLQLFRPLQPMLATPTEDLASAFALCPSGAWEYKLDGARVQVHKQRERVRIFSRRLNDVTAALPEVVRDVSALDADNAVLDGEVIALSEGGRPLPFQTTMRRFGRKLDVAKLQRQLPLSVFFFDLLYLDGTLLIDAPASQRYSALSRLVGAGMLAPRTVTDDREIAAAFVRQAMTDGHEGVMVKALDAPYAAGSRGTAWLKLKPAHTLDLVVLAAEWGSGRRRAWLSNLHLGARDTATGRFVMLGKTFKGLSDETLAWQTEALLARETHRDAQVVHVRAELVVEIAFNELQASPRYPGGLALRFARVKGYRHDKRSEEADTMETVRRIFKEGPGGAQPR